jgi:HD superfamily phosphohydrolase
MSQTPVRKTIIITDPIHSVMNFGSDPGLRKCLNEVLDTRTFQRLRRITQLGLTSYVFPGATHTRFSHSLGVAYLAYSVLAHLREWLSDGPEQEDLNQNFNAVIMSALLHDVGHGPFSHSFEQVLKNNKALKNKKILPPLHEDWTATFITNKESEIRQCLEGNKVDIEKVVAAFRKDGTSGLPLHYRQIVSSQIDVDRMDYLVRDSHFAGVAIGRFDVQYLINSMVVVTHGAGGPRTLGITPKGVKAYEAFLIARQLMNRTVYYHHKVKVLEFMVEHFIRCVLDNIDSLKGVASVRSFIPSYFGQVAGLIQKEGFKEELEKAQFLSEGLNDYVRLTEDVIWSLIASVADSKDVPFQGLAKKILKRHILPDYRIQEGKRELLRDSLVSEGLVEDVDFHLLELKTTMYKGNGDERVFVVDWEGDIEEIAAHSETISAFRDRPESEYLLIVLDETKDEVIQSLGKKSQFIVVREKGAPHGGVGK